MTIIHSPHLNTLMGENDPNSGITEMDLTIWAPFMQKAIDQAFAERTQCVALIAHMALKLGWKVGLVRAETCYDDGWNTRIFIDLPSVGQVSWFLHDEELLYFVGIPAYEGQWDGHAYPQTYQRIAAYAASLLRQPEEQEKAA